LRNTRLWIPRSVEPLLGIRRPAGRERDEHRLLVFGRLASGRTLSAASAELATIAARLAAELPIRKPGTLGSPEARRWSAKSIAAMSAEDNSLRKAGMTFVALVGLVLVVACTNLANLVLARGTARHGELSVRNAMGGS